jgi:hypothetical protein
VTNATRDSAGSTTVFDNPPSLEHDEDFPPQMLPSRAISPMSCVDEPITHFDDLPRSLECDPHPPEEDASGLPGPRTMSDHQVDIFDEMDLEPELFQEGEDAVGDDGNDDDLEGEDGARDDSNDEGEDIGVGGNDDKGESDVGDDGDDSEGKSLDDEYDINMSDNEIDFDIQQTPGRSSYD